MLVSKNFFCSFQNLPKHILVLKKSILEPLFTAYRLFKNVSFGVDPPPFLEKVYIFFCTLPLTGRSSKFARLAASATPLVDQPIKHPKAVATKV